MHKTFCKKTGRPGRSETVNRRWFRNLPVGSGWENPDRFHLWCRVRISVLSKVRKKLQYSFLYHRQKSFSIDNCCVKNVWVVQCHHITLHSFTTSYLKAMFAVLMNCDVIYRMHYYIQGCVFWKMRVADVYNILMLFSSFKNFQSNGAITAIVVWVLMGT